MNRTYAFSKADGKQKAIIEAEKLNLTDNRFYHSLLGNLYTDVNNKKALEHLETAFKLTKSKTDKTLITNNIKR